MGVILRGRSGEKSQVSSKCSRVRFSEIAFCSPPAPSPSEWHKNAIYVGALSPQCRLCQGEINILSSMPRVEDKVTLCSPREALFRQQGGSSLPWFHVTTCRCFALHPELWLWQQLQQSKGRSKAMLFAPAPLPSSQSRHWQSRLKHSLASCANVSPAVIV